MNIYTSAVFNNHVETKIRNEGKPSSSHAISGITIGFPCYLLDNNDFLREGYDYTNLGTIFVLK